MTIDKGSAKRMQNYLSAIILISRKEDTEEADAIKQLAIDISNILTKAEENA